MVRRLSAAVVGLLAVTAIGACGGEEPQDDMMPADTAPAAAPPAAPAPTPGATGALPEGVTQEMVVAGQQLFTGAGGCVACHGPDATGTALAPNLTDDTWINISGRNYDEIVNLIMTGVPSPVEAPAPMPPKGGSTITDDQVRQVAAYVYSLGG